MGIDWPQRGWSATFGAIDLSLRTVWGLWLPTTTGAAEDSIKTHDSARQDNLLGNEAGGPP